jgi:hypothetical protein
LRSSRWLWGTKQPGQAHIRGWHRDRFAMDPRVMPAGAAAAAAAAVVTAITPSADGWGRSFGGGNFQGIGGGGGYDGSTVAAGFVGSLSSLVLQHIVFCKALVSSEWRSHVAAGGAHPVPYEPLTPSTQGCNHACVFRTGNNTHCILQLSAKEVPILPDGLLSSAHYRGLRCIY